MGGAWASSVCSSGVLGLIDDPIAQDLQESQSKLINARWIDFVATENESSLSVFRDALTIINLLSGRSAKLSQRAAMACIRLV